MFLFLIAGNTQLRDAQSISSHLPKVRAVDLSAEKIKVTGLNDLRAVRHIPRPRMRDIPALLWTLEQVRRKHSELTLVSGQDIGTLQRIAFTWAAKQNVTTAIIPDGIIFDKPLNETVGRSTLGRARELFDRVGLLRGNSMEVGKTDPSLICSWGEGWNDVWRSRAPNAKILITGSSRIERRTCQAGSREVDVLLCSQPLWQIDRRLTDSALAAWYRWLSQSAISLNQLGYGVRIRLHPAELDALNVIPGIQDILPFRDLLNLESSLVKATHVLAPASSILLEADVAGCKVALVNACAAVSQMWDRSAVFRDVSFTTLSTNHPLTDADMDFKSVDLNAYHGGSIQNSPALIADALQKI